MSYKQERPVKYCIDCETHFHAPPGIHEHTYHPNGEWMWVPGTFREKDKAIEEL